MTEIALFRSVFLTLVFYGLSSVFYNSKFLLPLPAFEIAILLICFYLAYFIFKTDRWQSWLLIILGLTQFLGRLYNYSFFLQEETMLQLDQTLLVDVFFVLSGFILSFLLLTQRKRLKENKLIRLILSLLLLVGWLIPAVNQTFVLLPLAILIFIHFKEKNLFQQQHSVWAYLFLFILCREYMLSTFTELYHPPI